MFKKVKNKISANTEVINSVLCILFYLGMIALCLFGLGMVLNAMKNMVINDIENINEIVVENRIEQEKEDKFIDFIRNSCEEEDLNEFCSNFIESKVYVTITNEIRKKIYIDTKILSEQCGENHSKQDSEKEFCGEVSNEFERLFEKEIININEMFKYKISKHYPYSI